MDAGARSGHAQRPLGPGPEREARPLLSSRLHHRLQTARLYLTAPPLPLVPVPLTHMATPIYLQIMDGSLHLPRHHYPWPRPLWISRVQTAFTLRQVPSPLLHSAEVWKPSSLSRHRLRHHPRLPQTPPLAPVPPRPAHRRSTDTRFPRLRVVWATRCRRRA